MTDRKKVIEDDLIPNIGFNLEAQESFVDDHGITFEHYAAIPSPIGLKDRGDYRRSDAVDNIATGAFIYEKMGEFTATIVGNHKSYKDTDGGLFDFSMGRLILPKYYTIACDGTQDKEIQLLPADKIYVKDIEVKVPNWQRAQYNPNGVDVLQFPAKCVEMLRDSNNISYKQGWDFKVVDGNIEWIAGRKNPGIDFESGSGRIYSIRYTYLAHWYIVELINEIRVTNDGNGKPVRMPYHAVIQREYVYKDKNRASSTQVLQPKTELDRTNEAPKEKLDDNEYDVRVEISDFKNS